jgi:adenine-specific DNA-methyltransferase
MNLTNYHAKYLAHDLTRRQAGGHAERLAVAVASAQVDLNPHQVDAALFAFGSPLAKGALLADEVGLGKATALGAERKAIIFTESRRTQAYLLRRLADSPYSDGIVLFNGSNTDAGSRAIYERWLERHRGSDRVTGSRTADMRSALVEEFRDRAPIMIATEAGAEGINLQFCSLVVNYDLPWNPQRIEQRIGRCHRYGQKHDVVVVNFINRKNEADHLLCAAFADGGAAVPDEALGRLWSLPGRIGSPRRNGAARTSSSQRCAMRSRRIKPSAMSGVSSTG